ncbi:MAG: zinc-ribbon domain-containing protein [Oribacterium sp.]|nr:zinc-ribbon domain-containing protein [Oribacterium sp.]
MAGFCRKCGSPLGKNAMFCKKCGTRVVSIQSSQTVQKQVQPPKIQCRNCGYSLKEGAVFCRKCGTKVTDYQVVQPTIKETQNLQGTKVQHNQQQSIRTFESQKDQHYEQTASVNYAQPQQTNIQNEAAQYAQPQQNTFQNEAVRYAWQAQQQFTQNVQGMIQPMFSDAADRAGETALQLPQLQSALGFADEAKAVIDPFTQFFTGISGFFKGIINVFKDPKALTFSAVLSFIWMILIFMKQLGIGGVFTNALSWITFAQ